MDGLLVIDKPAGPTSHDIVAHARRMLRERRIGHTGTLDPMASGVLPLMLGRATRLARFLSAGDKHYTATVRFGVPTDTYDALGQPTRDPHVGPWPAVREIEQVLDRFRGTFVQQPPAFSAKKIEGTRSYQLARARARELNAGDSALVSSSAGPLPAPVSVTTRSVDSVSLERDLLTLSLVCSAGFYVRSLAHDLGEALGVGAHLAALRRTATSGVTLSAAVSMAEVDEDRQWLERAQAAIIPLGRMLPDMPRVDLTTEGASRAGKGRDVGPEHASSGVLPVPQGLESRFRLFDAVGSLIGIAERSAMPGFLHPAVVLV
jgi:tRNA pseudouridine55 synthase